MYRMTGKRKLFLHVLCLLILINAISANDVEADGPVVDRIVAVVNDEIITLFDLNQTLKPYEANIEALGYTPEKKRETLFKLRSDLLNKLIDQKLADQQIKIYTYLRRYGIRRGHDCIFEGPGTRTIALI